jgi:hypothetical protein
MTRLRNACGLLAVLFLVGWLVAADDKKAGDEPKAPAPRAKGQLPPGFKKLGLSDGQVQKVYLIQAAYKAKVDELDQKIRELKHQQRVEEYQVLTDAQKARLKELGEEKYFGDVKKVEVKKDDPKKDDPKKP